MDLKLTYLDGIVFEMEGVNFCGFCGCKLYPEDKFCPECGKKIEAIDDHEHCNVCGEKLSDDSRICPSCGVKIAPNRDYGYFHVFLLKYQDKINDLKQNYDYKDNMARQIVEKRFGPPQITYDRFISDLDNSKAIFYKKLESVEDILELITDVTPNIEDELNKKINVLEDILERVNDLINELVLNEEESKKSNEEIQSLLEDMDDLIHSVKDYE